MPGLMFHHFHSDGHPVQQGSLTADDLRRIIEKRNPISATAWLNGQAGNVLTFDDGLLCQKHIAAPVLKEYGLTAFFFVYTAPLVGVVSRLELYRRVRTTMFPTVDDFYDAFGWVQPAPADWLTAHTYLSQRDRDFRHWRDAVADPGDYELRMDAVIEALWHQGRSPYMDLWMTAHDLRALAAEGHIIGTHSHSHPTVLADLTKEAQEVEYATSTWILERVLGARPTAMSHPCNSYTPHGLDYLRTLGYNVGFRATPEAGAWGPLEVPRIDSADLVKEIQ